ncbi:hypothetical protein [Streptomyces jumonjinensis]|uniref:Uncharacterized protein n=1 Tax=Streptomyces jumonjinensis TaxID=1945 RepID=A0A646KTP9_STRJU|nr:hypothetical protein [Streptomyces jumonjinensis]MQT05417.1 hypothetical protein [Streptomyces jumonjinensis]
MNAPDPRSPGPSALPEAIRDLNSVCSEAGLSLMVCPNPDAPGREAKLGTADPTTVRQLTDLLRTSMKRTYDTVAALRSTLEAHGLKTPDLSVVAGEIVLGDLTVPDAERLARVLGAPPREPEADPVIELADWPQGKEVTARLDRAFRQATDGFIDLAFQPDCCRCGEKPAVSTGAISVGTARRLLDALEYGDRP